MIILTLCIKKRRVIVINPAIGARKMPKIIIYGQSITKKNSVNLVDIGKQCPCCRRKARSIPLPSKAFKAYEKLVRAQLATYPYQHKGPVEISCLYWLQTARMPDLNNLLAATADILQAARIIEDDKDIVSWDGSRIMGKDVKSPRVEITIIELKETP
jgi:Holliday junction resolvase RusA-like endonuclease